MCCGTSQWNTAGASCLGGAAPGGAKMAPGVLPGGGAASAAATAAACG